ncbi:MAG TPA: hypothetical protein VNB22_00885 [Pyrinomonadaceae bacterium]|nr:hypothetical protein [Pyrinomonadaceae bacterium]
MSDYHKSKLNWSAVISVRQPDQRSENGQTSRAVFNLLSNRGHSAFVRRAARFSGKMPALQFLVECFRQWCNHTKFRCGFCI